MSKPYFNNAMEGSAPPQGKNMTDPFFNTEFPLVTGTSTEKNIKTSPAKTSVAIRLPRKSLPKNPKTPTVKKTVGKNYFLRKAPKPSNNGVDIINKNLA